LLTVSPSSIFFKYFKKKNFHKLLTVFVFKQVSGGKKMTNPKSKKGTNPKTTQKKS